MPYTLIFDGGNNPTDGAYGSYVIHVEGDIVEERLRIPFPEGTTNNMAEYMSLVHGLEAVCKMMNPQYVSIVVQGDSQLVLNQVRGDWQVMSTHLRPLCARCIGILRGFREVRLEWIGREKVVEWLGH